MLAEVVEPLAMKTGSVKKIDYEHLRKGVAAVFVAVEPVTGKRMIRVFPEERKPMTAAFSRKLSRFGKTRKSSCKYRTI